MSSASLVDQSMAAMLEPGSVAALGYSNKIPATLLGIGAMALGTAVLPYYSKMVANGDWKGVDHTLKVCRWKILQVSISVTLSLFLFRASRSGYFSTRRLVQGAQPCSWIHGFLKTNQSAYSSAYSVSVKPRYRDEQNSNNSSIFRNSPSIDCLVGK